MWQFLSRLARQLPAEAAHQLAVETLRWQLGPRPAINAVPIDFAVKLGGITFPNPIGLAAGFDKNAACYHGALRLGFGHVEVGTIPRYHKLAIQSRGCFAWLKIALSSTAMDLMVRVWRRRHRICGAAARRGCRWGQCWRQ